MERINFETIGIQNFMSFEDTTLKLRSSGLHFVYGEVEGQLADSNGAGKSAWVEAIAWCLFGKTLREMKADEVVNSNVGKDCSVYLTFAKGQKTYSVRRYRETDKGSGVSLKVLDDKKEKNLDISGADNATTNEKIETLLGFSFDLFKNTICHGQGLPYRFTQATDAEKKEIFDEILNLGWMVGARKRAAELEKRYREVINEETTQQVALKEKVLLLEESLKTQDEKRTEVKSQKPPAQDADRLKDLAARKQELVDKINARKARLIKVKDLLERVEKKAQPGKYAGVEYLRGHISNIKAWVAEKEKTKAELVEQVKSTKELIGKPCPVCARTIRKEDSDAARKHVKKELDKLVKDIEEQTGMLDLAKTRYEEAVVKRGKLNDKLDILKSQKSSLELDNEANAGEIATLDAEMSHIHGRTEAWKSARAEQLADLDLQIDQSKSRLREAKNKVRESDGMIRYTEKLVSVVAFWSEAFGNRGIRSLVLDNVIPFLNQKAQEYSEVLTDGKFKIEFRAQSETQRGEVREKFVVDVRNHENGVLYSSFSGGERRRVDVIVLLALHDLIAFQSGIDSNIQIFDEVVESLDEIGIQRLMGLLKTRSESRGIYIISHDSDLNAQFDYSVKVVKDGSGNSKIISRRTVN